MLASMVKKSLSIKRDRGENYPWHRADIHSQTESLWITIVIFFAFLLLTVPVMAQDDSLSGKAAVEKVQKDSIPQEDNPESTQKDSPADKPEEKVAEKESLPEKNENEKSELVNIVLDNKRIRPYGWGEYRVGGRCLCCDNKNDGDCIVVHTIERTNRLRITQIKDGKIEGDTSNSKTFFGNITKRNLPEEPVTWLMVDIPLGKAYEIRKVIVHTMIDHEKHRNFLSNCKLGYYDQFNRLLWLDKVESKKYDEPLAIEMKNPILTKKILLKVRDGRSRITEVSIFSRSKKK